MNFYVDSGGNVFAVDPEKVYQGQAYANTIRMIGAFASNLAVTVGFTLPNGFIISPRLMTNVNDLSEKLEGFSVWEYKIPFVVTEYAGKVGVQFYVHGSRTKTVFVKNDEGKYENQQEDVATVIATGESSFNVEKGVPIYLPDKDEIPDYDNLLADILGALSASQERYNLTNLENGTGENSLQQKDSTESLGDRAVALNHKTKAYQRASMAIGGGTQAGMTEEEFAIYGDIIGGATEYDKAYSFAFSAGEGTKSIARGGFTTGHWTENYGIYGFAGGVSSKNYAQHGFVFGDQIVVTAERCATGFGYKTRITSNWAFAVNYLNAVEGEASFAANYNNTVYAKYAFVVNVSNIANSGAYASALFGVANESNYPQQLIGGKYNENKDNTLLEIGNGESWKRSNAFEVYKDGKVVGGRSTVPTDGEKTLATKDYVDEKQLYRHFLSIYEGDILQANGMIYNFSWISSRSTPYTNISELLPENPYGIAGVPVTMCQVNDNSGESLWVNGVVMSDGPQSPGIYNDFSRSKQYVTTKALIQNDVVIEL